MLKNILIADKSPIFRQAIAKILIDAGIDKTAIAFVESDDDVLSFLEFSVCDLLVLGTPYQDSDCQNIITSLKQNNTLPQYTLTTQQFSPTNGQKIVSQLTEPLTETSVLKMLYMTTQLAVFEQRLAQLAKPETTHAPKYEDGKILVVDDEPANIDVAMGHLKGRYKVLAAKSGQQTLDIAHKNYQSIDVILLDIMMPGIDGFEVCRQLKSHQATKHIPIIFLTAKTEIDDIVTGLNLGAVDYITKPFQPQILLARVQTHYQLSRQAKALLEQVCALEENAELRESIDQLTRHDLKGPLARVLFEADKVPDKQLGAEIRSATNQVLDMINNSLDVYKIEKGNYPLNSSPVNVIKVIDNALKGIGLQAKDKDICLNFEHPSEDLHILGEEMLCISIFNNVIKNAIEASPEHVSVIIKAGTKGKFAWVSCLNEGTVPKEIRANLFDKFASSNHIKGSGFGTYSAKIMTEVQGGTIGFEIIGDTHTLFTITLPLSE